MGLDRQTEQRMRELFGGRRCCVCGAAAARLMDDRFYCHVHFLVARRGHKRGPKPQTAAWLAPVAQDPSDTLPAPPEAEPLPVGGLPAAGSQPSDAGSNPPIAGTAAAPAIESLEQPRHAG